MTPARISPRARRDLAAAVAWIADDNPAAARSLVDAVRGAAERIGEHPQIGVVRQDLTGGPYRFLALTGFPYLIVYFVDRNPRVIVRIVHGARDLPRVLRSLL